MGEVEVCIAAINDIAVTVFIGIALFSITIWLPAEIKQIKKMLRELRIYSKQK